MNLTVLKIILLVVMFFFSIFCGLLPLKVQREEYPHFQANSFLKRIKRASLILSMLACFAGGVFFGVCILDILHDALESLDDVFKATGWHSDYPFVQLLAGTGFFLVYAFEVVLDLLGYKHSHESEE